MTSDTIAAIATAPGRGGIGVVRISGKGLLPLAHALCHKTPVSRHATIADFFAQDGAVIDRGLLIFSLRRIHLPVRM
jgi:Predicted GTPase